MFVRFDLIFVHRTLFVPASECMELAKNIRLLIVVGRSYTRRFSGSTNGVLLRSRVTGL